MPTLSIEMTEAELFALDLIAINKQEWADNVLTDRARVAKDELKQTAQWAQILTQAINSGIDGTDDWAVLLFARDNGLLKTAAQIEEARQLEEAQGVDNATGETDPLTLPLNQIQFFTLLEVAFGKTSEDVVVIIEQSITDPMQRVAAKNKFLRSQNYERSDPMFAMLAPVLGITSEQIDAAWIQALQIQ